MTSAIQATDPDIRWGEFACRHDETQIERWIVNAIHLAVEGVQISGQLYFKYCLGSRENTGISRWPSRNKTLFTFWCSDEAHEVFTPSHVATLISC